MYQNVKISMLQHAMTLRHNNYMLKMGNRKEILHLRANHKPLLAKKGDPGFRVKPTKPLKNGGFSTPMNK